MLGDSSYRASRLNLSPGIGQNTRNVLVRAISRLAVLVAVAVFGLATPAAAAEPTILLYGDSLLAGLGLDAAESFEGQLRAALLAEGIEARLVNASVSGDTTAAGRDRLAWTLGERPDAVILGLGANDMLRGVPVEETRANLDAILDELAAADLPVLLFGMKADRGLGADYVQSFDGLYPALAEQHQVPLYPFYLQAIGLDAQFYQADLRHPNAQGVARIVADLLPMVEALIARLR
jgi:acyl-CoA thioesterase-1